MRGDAADLSKQGPGETEGQSRRQSLGKDEVVSVYIAGGGHMPLYSAPLRRRGPAAVFAVDVARTSGSATVRIDHRNVGDTSWTTAGTFSSVSHACVRRKDISGLKERWRWVLIPGGTPESAVLVRMRPIWKPKSSSETRTKE